MTGFNVKLVEKSGPQLGRMFDRVFRPNKCHSDRCVVCKYACDKGSKCCLTNVVYSAQCLECMKEQRVLSELSAQSDAGNNKNVNKKVPNRKATKSDKKTGLYVGETSRCLFERSNEQIDGMLNGDDKNFIIKHWALKHSKLETPPEKKFSVIKTHQDALSRVIQEAILIECDADINSKSEWRQNAKPRLVIEQTNKQREKEDIEMAIANCEQQKLIDAIILKVTRMKDEKGKNDEKGVVGEKNVVDDGKIYRNNKGSK